MTRKFNPRHDIRNIINIPDISDEVIESIKNKAKRIKFDKKLTGELKKILEDYEAHKLTLDVGRRAEVRDSIKEVRKRCTMLFKSLDKIDPKARSLIVLPPGFVESDYIDLERFKGTLQNWIDRCDELFNIIPKDKGGIKSKDTAIMICLRKLVKLYEKAKGERAKPPTWYKHEYRGRFYDFAEICFNEIGEVFLSKSTLGNEIKKVFQNSNQRPHQKPPLF